jgi:hypothetical protein
VFLNADVRLHFMKFGQAITFAALGIDVLRIWTGPEPNPNGDTRSGEIIATSRRDSLATLHASDIAIEELCVRRLSASGQYEPRECPRATSPGRIKDHERSQARRRAREIVRIWSDQVVTLAHALLAMPNGVLRGANLDKQLAHVHRWFTE